MRPAELPVVTYPTSSAIQPSSRAKQSPAFTAVRHSSLPNQELPPLTAAPATARTASLQSSPISIPQHQLQSQLQLHAQQTQMPQLSSSSPSTSSPILSIENRVTSKGETNTSIEAKPLAAASSSFLSKGKKKLKSALSSNAPKNTITNTGALANVCYDDIANFRLTEKQLTAVVLRYYKDYKKLLDTIKNTNGLSSVIDSLSQMFYWIIVTFALTIAMNRYFHQQQFVITLSTVFFSLTFVFSQSLRDMFAAIIFLFYIKPFSVGDRVDIGTGKYRVVSIQLLTTTFRTLDQRITTMTNSSLASAVVTNLSNSKNAVAKWSFFVEMNTPCHSLALLRQRIVEHIIANPKDWTANVSMNFTNVLPNSNALQISLWLKSKYFYTDVKLVKRAKTEVLHVVREAMLDLGIKWVYPGVDVNLLDDALMIDDQTDSSNGAATGGASSGGGGKGGGKGNSNNQMMQAMGGRKGMKMSGRGGKRLNASSTTTNNAAAAQQVQQGQGQSQVDSQAPEDDFF
jgi:small-conductance mechanosensitive channel